MFCHTALKEERFSSNVSSPIRYKSKNGDVSGDQGGLTDIATSQSISQSIYQSINQSIGKALANMGTQIVENLSKI